MLRRFWSSLPVFDATTKVSTCRLMVFAAASVFASTVRCRGVRSTMRRAIVVCRSTRSGMGRIMGCTAGSATTRCYCMATPTIGSIGTPVSTPSDVPSAATAVEPMFAPAVAVAPVRPGSHAQEDAVIEISRPIKATGCAAVRCIVVIAVGTDRLNAYADADLCTGGWRQGQRDEQCCCTGQKKTPHC